MEVLWKDGSQNARQIAKLLNKDIGWNVNTTYTVIKKCIAKGAIRRCDPGFLCIPLIKKEEVQKEETEELINKMFDGSRQMFLAGFLKSQKLDQKEIERLKRLIEELKGAD